MKPRHDSYQQTTPTTTNLQIHKDFAQRKLPQQALITMARSKAKHRFHCSLLILLTTLVTSTAFLQMPGTRIRRLQNSGKCNNNNNNNPALDDDDANHHQRARRRRQQPTTARSSSSNNSDESPRQHHQQHQHQSSKFDKFRQLGRRYLHLCETRPVLTKSVTASILAAAGDALSQSVSSSGSGNGMDWLRWRTFILIGLLFEGPWFHHWFAALGRLGCLMQDKWSANKPAQVAAQTVTDQTVGVALFFPLYFVVYEVVNAVLAGRVPDLAAAIQHCRTDVWAIVLTQYKVWPAVNALNFYLVPESLRVLVSNVVAVVWNAYLTATVAGSL